jgi:hypothetical protein
VLREESLRHPAKGLPSLQRSAGFPIGDAAFPIGDATFPIGDAAFPIGDATFLIGDATFPIGDATFPIGNATFLIGDATFPIGDATFPIGNAVSEVGSVAKPCHFAAFSPTFSPSLPSLPSQLKIPRPRETGIYPQIARISADDEAARLLLLRKSAQSADESVPS